MAFCSPQVWSAMVSEPKSGAVSVPTGVPLPTSDHSPSPSSFSART